jgi:hypothetical protein
MGHGYMREYDEDRGDMRDRDDRWRDQYPGDDRNPEFMMGDRNRNSDRGNSSPTSAGSRTDWDRGPDRPSSRGPTRSDARDQRQFGGISNHQDDHYRSWRTKQMEALDRDYADYCREREQQFHSDFDMWRSQRRDNVQPLQTGMTQTSTGTDPEGTLDLTTSLETSSQAQPAMADAAVGTAPNRNRR